MVVYYLQGQATSMTQANKNAQLLQMNKYYITELCCDGKTRQDEYTCGKTNASQSRMKDTR